MSSSNFTYAPHPGPSNHVVREEHIEYGFIGKLQKNAGAKNAGVRSFIATPFSHLSR
jgi:hypothetical protein